MVTYVGDVALRTLGVASTGLVFDDHAPVIVSDPNRADVALFVGYVARRKVADGAATPLPTEVDQWLDGQGWKRPGVGQRDLKLLADVPVPVDSWAVFDQLFDWQARPVRPVAPPGGSAPIGGEEKAGASGQVATTYLGAAVRSFFSQGGRKCYVVSVGEPWPVLEGAVDEADKAKRVAALIPGYPLQFDAARADPAGWHGMAHVLGLPDVSFLCLPDLPDALGLEPGQPRPIEQTSRKPEVFVACSTGELADVAQDPSRRIRVRRCDEDGYAEWARAISLAAGGLAKLAREVQLVAALPLPVEGEQAAKDPLGFLNEGRVTRGGKLLGQGAEGPLSVGLFSGLNGLASAFVQLAYPWVRTAGSGNLPEGLESPDGVLTGVLARNALERGAFRSAAGLHLADVDAVFPVLAQGQMHGLARYARSGDRDGRSLLQRVSLFGPTPDGGVAGRGGRLRLLSDVTTSLQESYRPAAVNRLTSAIVRAARILGEELAFESSGEALWAQVRGGLERLLLGLLQAGALRGSRPDEAFRVRCDRSTMTQNDIDAGRVIAEVQFDPVAPVERITVVLSLSEGGQIVGAQAAQRG